MIDKIKAAIEKVDVLVTTGSVSMGDRDMLKPILQKHFEATIHFGIFLLSSMNINMSTYMFLKILNIYFLRSCKYETGKANDLCNMLI
jgi:hypothetical protein